MRQAQAYIEGMEHAARIAKRHKRGESSRQVFAIRREIATIRLKQETRQTLRSKFLPAVLALCFVAAFEVLFLRAIVIESDWQHKHFCNFNQTTNCN